jgi:hypothetical protein
MRIFLKMSIVFCLVLSLIGFSATTVQALTMSKLKGLGATTSFVSTRGCIQTNVDIFTVEGMLKDAPGSPGPVSSLNIYISRYDLCTDTQVLYVDAIADLAEPDLIIASKLENATLNTTLHVQDTISGDSFDVVIDVTWAGVGSTTRARHNFHFGDATCKVQDRYNAVERGAVATGSVSVGTENLTPEPSVGGLLISSNGSITAIGCT